MRADAVVPVLKNGEVAIELRYVRHLPLVEFLFECAKQAFYSAVLPRATGVGELMADAEVF